MALVLRPAGNACVLPIFSLEGVSILGASLASQIWALLFNDRFPESVRLSTVPQCC